MVVTVGHRALVVFSVLISGCMPLADGEIGHGLSRPIRADHHVHLNSPAIQTFVPDYCRAVARFGDCDPALTTLRTPADLIQAMDNARIERAALLSNGYLAESGMVTPRRHDAAELMRAANDWTVSQARLHPDRLVAFVSVDPTQPTALPEIKRWSRNPAVAGVKLHLTASGTDFRDDADVAALAAVFSAAAEERFAILIHLRTRRADYGAADVRRFVADVLPAAGSSPVQIAHLGGWGEIDKPTLETLGAFAYAIERAPDRLPNLLFDLSGALSDQTSMAQRHAVATLIRRIGPHRFLPGSDWPFTTDLARLYEPLYPELPLSHSEIEIIRGNVAPYLKARKP